MKQELLNLKSWLLMMCLLVGVGTGWAADATFTFSEQGYTNAQVVSSGTIDSYTSWSATDGTNSAAYYTTGTGLRVYDGGTFTVTSTKTIASITLTFSGSSFTFSASNTTTPQTVSPNATSYSWDVSRTCRLQKVEIIYAGSSTTTYNVSVAKDIVNGTVTANTTSAKEGDEITLTATPNTGYELGSWKVTNASTSEAITVTDNKFRMPAANVNVSAIFNQIQGGGGEDTPTESFVYKKVTSQDDIVNGGVYIIVCEDQNTAMGSQADSRRNNASVTISNNSISLNSVNTDDAPYEVTLAEDDDLYKMVLSNGSFLGNGSANSNNLKEVKNYAVGYGWTLTYNTDKTVTMKTNHTTARYLCVNTSNTKDSYATYTKTDNYKNVTLYKKESTATPEPTVPTFASLADLIAADQSYDAVNVTIDDKVFATMVDPEMPGLYAVMLADSRVMLASAGEDLGWLAGGTVTGTLKNVQWKAEMGDEVAGALMSKESFWSSLTYTAPEVVPVFNSIDELLDAKLADGTTVTVTVNGTITKTEASQEPDVYVIELDNKFSIGALSSDLGWKVGGTVSGTLVNVNFGRDEESGVPGVVSTTENIFEEALTYTAPAAPIVPTYTLSEFIAKRDDLTENDVFNVTIEDDITIVNTHDATDAKAYKVTISPDSYVWVSIYAPAPTTAKEWTVGGSLSGTLNNVTWNGSEIVGEDASVWEGLTYKPIQTYTLSELFGTPSKDYVNVEVDDVVESCVKDAGVYKVTLNSGVSLIIRTDNLDWVADGTVKGTLNDVQWRGDNNTIYGKTNDYWEALTYNAPAPAVPTFNSLEELIDANLEEPTVVNVTLTDEEVTMAMTHPLIPGTYIVVLNGGNTIGAPGADLGWTQGGTVSGTLENVTWDPEERSLTSEDGETFWSSLSYTAPAGAPQESITLYKACNDGEFYYSTYSSTNAFYVPKDLIVYEVMVEGNKIALEPYDIGDLVPPYTGVLVCSDDFGAFYVDVETDYDMIDEFANSVLGKSNALRPTCYPDGITAEDMAAEDPGMEYYRLTMQNGTKCGFWWGAEYGAAFNIAPNKAYLVAPKNSNVKGFTFRDVVNAVKNAMAEKAEGEVRYNLNGQRVNANAKGIIIVNGKKVIKK